MQSRAQTELNFAVYWSFEQSGVRMSDSLTASTMYCNFDDEHLQEHGFRLPADPYWLAPPQGSLVPLWHRGGAPNYQPKPLICRHVQDPINAWQRRKGIATKDLVVGRTNHAPPNGTRLEKSRSIRIHYCSSGTTAHKLAQRLHRYVSNICEQSAPDIEAPPIDTLNALDLNEVRKNDVILVIASSCGRGDVPYNGQAFMKRSEARRIMEGVEFAIYGNGSSSYRTSFNGAARSLESVLREGGGHPVLGLFEGDADKENPPWRQLSYWWGTLQQRLFGFVKLDQLAMDEEYIQGGFETLAARSIRATLISSTSNIKGVKQVALDIGNFEYAEMSHVDIFIPNRRIEVEQVLAQIGLKRRDLKLIGELTARQFLTELADLHRPFTTLQWASTLNLNLGQLDTLRSAPFPQSLKTLARGWRKGSRLTDIFAAMPLKRPRTYSAASSQQFWEHKGQRNVLELLVQTRPRGSFSEDFLAFAPRGTSMRVRIRPTSTKLVHDPSPVIAFATGSGMAPVRSLLQARIVDAQQNREADSARPPYGPVSLFVGFKDYDANTIAAGTLDRASKLGLVDMLFLTPSNTNKARAQDKMFAEGVRDRIVAKMKDEGANVLVCASAEAARDFARNLSALLGRDVKDALGERYVEEVFEPAA